MSAEPINNQSTCNDIAEEETIDDEQTITACLVSFAQENGFVDIQLKKEPLTQKNLFAAAHKFFIPGAKLKGARVAYSSSGNGGDNAFDIIILFDQGLHGQQVCPYLAVKSINRDTITNLGRDDYMEVMRAVEFVMAKILPKGDGQEASISNQKK
ncbi:hypothetical protein F4604DRAFT_1679203 [Suillus subluteus]|nr:hypothetical protein F4604DRAFT_1679203 [Suillus subluteus]